jgi:hypothetical protein
MRFIVTFADRRIGGELAASLFRNEPTMQLFYLVIQISASGEKHEKDCSVSFADAARDERVQIQEHDRLGQDET